SYDGAGNLLNDGLGHTLAYDGANRIKTLNGTGATYTYLPNGDRVRKDVGTNWTEYVSFGGNVIGEFDNTSTWTDYIFVKGQRIGQTNTSATSSTQYYHSDHLGTARLMTDSTGAIVSNCTYAPFGQEASCSPSNARN